MDPARYDRARPPYPEALVQRVVAALPGRRVLDVGCGTGIEARQFQRAGCTVLGVDPDERMAGFARRTGVEVEVATFEEWPAAGRTYDAVVAGQAWHWVDPVAGAAKAVQVLRPDGLLAVFAHVFQPPAGIAEAQRVAFQRAAPDSPMNIRSAADEGPAKTPLEVYQEMFDTFADGIRQTDGLSSPEQWQFDWELHYTREEWLELLPTTGALTRLPADKLAEVLDAVGTAIDSAGGGFTMPYITLAVTSVRAEEPSS